MAKLSVARVQLSCSVEGCTNVEDEGMFLDRHHVRSQKLFVRAFRLRGSARYKAFVERYDAFHPADIVKLCRECHEEVHGIYRLIIGKHCWKLRLRLRDFSWVQAEILMDDFEKEFWRWKEGKEKRLAKLHKPRTRRT